MFRAPNLVLNGSNGLAGRTYMVVTSTDITAALSQWSPVSTNVLAANGAFTITATNVVNPGDAQRFYALQAQ